MPPSTLRQITILQLGPTEVESLREGGALPLPISPEMGVLFQQGRAELYVTIGGRNRLPKMHTPIALPVSETTKATQASKHPIIWTPEETWKVLQVFNELMAKKDVSGINKGLMRAQEQVLPPDRHRSLGTVGHSQLRQLRQKATKYRPPKAKAKVQTPKPTKTEKPITKEFACVVGGCAGISKTGAGLAGHMIGTHASRAKMNGITYFTCKICSTYSTAEWSEFFMHLKTEHGK